MSKTLVILANSVKHHLHCVAGKDIDTKEWIRPVSNVVGEALTTEQSSYTNKGSSWKVKPLDKIIIEFSEHVPLQQQPENYLISQEKWASNFKINRDDLAQYVDTPQNIWLDMSTNTNRVTSSLVASNEIVIVQSLYLIKIDLLSLQISTEHETFVGEKRKLRGSFEYNGVKYYDLTITDPKIWSEYKEKLLGMYELKDVYLCLSLGEEFHGFYYKIIAAII
jgi:hypothetical protein